MRVPLLRVPPHHAARGTRRREAQRRARPTLSRALLAHLAWSAVVIGLAATVIGAELTVACPPGGPLSFGGQCDTVRPFLIGVLALSALVYVVALSGVRWWTSSLVSRGVADARAARDWYLLAALLGLLVAPLLAFTLASALR